MHLSYHNMFPDVSYVFPQRRSQDPSRCTQKRMWRADCCWTSLSCSHPPISQPGDYDERSLSVHHVPHYLWYYSSNPFSIHAFNHRECAKLSRAVCWQYRLNQPYPRSNPNLTHQLNPGDLFPLSSAELDLGVNPKSPRIPTTSTYPSSMLVALAPPPSSSPPPLFGSPPPPFKLNHVSVVRSQGSNHRKKNHVETQSVASVIYRQSLAIVSRRAATFPANEVNPTLPVSSPCRTLALGLYGSEIGGP
jgi:hypothetical protein